MIGKCLAKFAIAKVGPCATRQPAGRACHKFTYTQAHTRSYISCIYANDNK